MRSFLYSKDCPQGQIFTDEDKFLQAKKNGWVEAPQEIGKELVTNRPQMPGVGDTKRKPGRPPKKDK